MDATHPDHDSLIRFGHGLLAPEQAGPIEAHLSTCNDCAAVLTAQGRDTLGDLLLQPPPPLKGPAPGPDCTQEWSEAPAQLADHPRYRVLGLLGQGGMGRVYLAEHRHLGRPVALKVIDPALLENPAAVRRFTQEARAAASLSHPHIVQAHDAEEAGGLHFLVMEYVRGTNLAALAAVGPLPVGRACEYVRQAALGLAHAHEQGLVHRDVKPHNLMLTEDGLVKVLDFGLARLAGEARVGDGSTTAAGTLLGTPDYLPPEQARDAANADARSDVYSLGCTLFHLLTGRPPFVGGGGIEKVARHLSEGVPTLQSALPDAPEGLAAVVARMTERDPARRYQSAAEVAEALAPFTSPRPAPPPRFPMAWAAALVGLCLLAAGAAAVHHVWTDTGELVITTESDDVEVVIKQGGKVVRVVDARSGEAVVLRSGVYELELKGGKGLKLSVDKATLTRGGKVLARIERRPSPARPAPPTGTVKQAIWGNATGGIVNFSPDGRWVVVSGGWPVGKVAVFRASTARLLREYDGLFARMAPDGKHIVAAKEWEWLLYEIQTGKLVRSARIPSGYWGHTISPDGRLLLVDTADRAVRLYEIATGKCIRSWRMGFPDPLNYDWFYFAADSKALLRVSRRGGKCLFPARRIDLVTGKEEDAFPALRGKSFCLDGLTLRGRQAATPWTTYGPFRDSAIIDLKTGKITRKYTAPKGSEAATVNLVSPDGTRLMSAFKDGSVRIWGLAGGKQLAHLPGLPGKMFSAFDWSADGKQAAVTHTGGTLRIWAAPGK